MKKLSVNLLWPFDYFKSLTLPVKLTCIGCLTFISVVFMYFTYHAGYWGDFMAWLFNVAKDTAEARK